MSKAGSIEEEALCVEGVFSGEVGEVYAGVDAMDEARSEPPGDGGCLLERSGIADVDADVIS